MLLPGAERKRDQERTFVKTDQRLVEDGAGGVGHGRTLEVGIDICTYVRPPIGSGKGEGRTDLLGGNCRFRPREDSSGSKVCAPSGSGGTPKEDESTRSSSGRPEVAAPAWEVNVRCNVRHRPQIVDEEARCSERKKGPEARCPAILRPVRDVNSDSGCTK
jgi:hypothetical protein